MNQKPNKLDKVMDTKLDSRVQREFSNDGTFKRQKNSFVTPFGDLPGQLPVEPDRYRLFWSDACPWAHRTVIVRKLLGLEDVISLGTVGPIRPRLPHVDWEFNLDPNGVDPVLGITYLSEIYKETDPEYSGRPTVPAVVDVKTRKVVNNDYFQLTNYLETTWAPFHKQNAPNLYPEHLRTQIDNLNEIIFQDINNGVYKCGFARSQHAYEESYDVLFARLDELESLLSNQRFLLGEFITDSDIRLYTTLVRFDIAYYSAFKTNRQLIREFPNLWGYVRDLYQTPGFKDTTNFEAIKQHYHMSITISPDKSEVSILPKGPDLSGWTSKHCREKFSTTKDKYFYEGAKR